MERLDAATILDHVRESIFALDASWHLVYMNRTAREGFRKVTGQGEEDALGRDARAVFPYLTGDAAERLAAVMRTGSTVQFEHHIPALDRWYHASAFPMEDGGVVVHYRDITLRKGREAELIALRDRLERVLEASPVILVRLQPADAGFTPDWVSSNIERILGYEPGEVCVPDWLLSIIHPEDLPTLRGNREVLLRKGRSRMRMRLRARDGGYRRFIAKHRLTEEPDGQRFVYGSLTDVTEREEAEEERERTERLFGALIEHSPDVLVILDEDGAVRYASPSLERVLGRSPADLIGTNAFRLVHPADLPVVAQRFGRALRGIVGTPLEIRLRRADGSWAAVETVGSRLPPPEAGVIVNARDVSDRAALASVLRQEEELFRKLVDALDETGVAMLGPLGHIVSWNLGAANLLGRSEADVLGRHASILFHDERQGAAFVSRIVAAHDGTTLERVSTTLRTRDGARLPALLTSRRLEDEDGEIFGYACVFHLPR